MTAALALAAGLSLGAATAEATPGGVAAASDPQPTSTAGTDSGTANDGGGDGRLTFGVTTASGGATDDRGYISVDAPPGSTLYDAVGVENLSDAPLDVVLYTADVVNAADGALDAGTRDAPKELAGAWLALDRDSASLPAQSSKGPGLEIVPVTITIPRDAEPGDHLASVISSVTATGRAGENTPEVDLEHRVGVRVYVRVQGDIRPGLTITDVHADFRAGGAFGAGTMDVTYTLTNSGNVRFGVNPSVRASGIFGLLPRTGDGKAIEELLPHSTVTQTVTLENVYPLLLENVVVSATAVAARGADDPALGTVRASSWTWLWSWTVLVILVVVALGITIWQVQRRRRKPGEWGPPEGLWRHSGAGSPAGRPPVEGERELSRHGGA